MGGGEDAGCLSRTVGAAAIGAAAGTQLLPRRAPHPGSLVPHINVRLRRIAVRAEPSGGVFGAINAAWVVNPQVKEQTGPMFKMTANIIKSHAALLGTASSTDHRNWRPSVPLTSRAYRWA